jgi:HAD superfamily hydrolase (TIGR01509 family)
MAIDAIVFDLDGVLIDSEPVWEDVRRDFVARHGGTWPDDAQRRLMGMSTREWAAYLGGEMGVAMPPEEIARGVIDAMAERYEQRLPLLPGAVDAVRRVADRWPLGLASSSPPRLIELALERAGLDQRFGVALSTEDVPNGKPAPDVYLRVAERMGVDPRRCVAIEDSSNGLRSAKAAGMRLVAVPRPRYPPDKDALAAADIVMFGLKQLSVDALERLGG